jgi:hypothetical protein
VTIEDLGSLGELIAAIATVITLGYLALQIRANTRSLRLAAQESTTAGSSRFRDALIRDPEVAALWNRALADYDGLPSDERVRALSMFQEVFYTAQVVFHRYREGVLPEQTWRIYIPGLRSILRNPGAQQWWKRAERFLDPEFVAVIREARDDADPAA